MTASSERALTTEEEYPYTRSEECAWQPEDVARHIAALAYSKETSNTTQLLSHGWPSRQISLLRRRFGANRMKGDAGSEGNDEISRGLRGRLLSKLQPIVSGVMSQFREPLILMLLGSAAVSVILGNVADAVSISIALLIVSLVAAVQEYRSDVALEKLAHLVPHACSVVRDGKVMDDFLAVDLVVGDLVILSTGE